MILFFLCVARLPVYLVRMVGKTVKLAIAKLCMTVTRRQGGEEANVNIKSSKME